MTKRILLAGLLGGLAMYVWTSVAHVALPLGQTGIREIPNEGAVLGALHATLGDAAGMYLFPGMGGSSDMKQYEAKLATSPSGLLIYRAPGEKGMTPARLIIEFITEWAEALLLAWLMAQSRQRLLVALVVGLVAVMTTNVSYWNWYTFPASYTVAQIGTELVGFLVAGLVAAKVLGRASA